MTRRHRNEVGYDVPPTTFTATECKREMWRLEVLGGTFEDNEVLCTHLRKRRRGLMWQENEAQLDNLAHYIEHCEIEAEKLGIY